MYTIYYHSGRVAHNVMASDRLAAMRAAVWLHPGERVSHIVEAQ